MNTESRYEQMPRAVPALRPESAAPLNANRARKLALECGFTEAGLAPLPYPGEERDAARFEQWIGEGRAASMQYLQRADEQGRLVRARPRTPFPWARSAIVCLANYNCAQPRSTDAAPEGSGWIARYAWSSSTGAKGRRPSDYHKVLLKRLRALESRLKDELGEFESRAYVDTGPVVERSLAVAAGLGWTGKNTCLIHPRLGSYGFLAVLLTALPVESEAAPAVLVPDRCGTCRRCIDACPTQALTAPRQMDARRCISYLTIEHKGAIGEELMAQMGRQVFGCDICQDVCPWNSPRRAPVADDGDLAAREELVNPALEWLAGLDEAAFEREFNGSPVRRAGFAGLRRNAAIAMGNSGLRRFAATLERWAKSTDEGVSAAARWALATLREKDDAPE